MSPGAGNWRDHSYCGVQIIIFLSLECALLYFDAKKIVVAVLVSIVSVLKIG